MAQNRIFCPKCEHNFGQESKFLEHLNSAHGVVDYEQFYCDTFLSGFKLKCACSVECVHFVSWSGWKKGYVSKYARGHNARVDSIYLNKDKQREMAAKRAAGLAAGKYKIWNSGLTKETSQKLEQTSHKISKTIQKKKCEGTFQDWRVFDPEKAKLAAKKVSSTKRALYAKGVLTPWNKGLTKFDDDRVAAISKGVSENHAENAEASSKRLTPEQFLSRVNQVENFQLISDHDCYKNKYQKFQFICKTCGEIQSKSLMMLESSPVCFFCKPKESKSQLEIFKFVQTLDSTALLSDRMMIAPKELDIWVPSSNFAIEYNGLYWHSEAVLSDNRYHQKKHEACREKGINLLSIYEDEWRDKREIIEGMIRYRLKCPLTKWSARKLDVVELSKDLASNFIESNHLEGHVRCDVAFGLVDKNSGLLLAAMSLRRPFHKKYSNALEVARCCVRIGHSIRGWLGKLTAHVVEYAKNKVSRLITYVDARVGHGSGYERAGWAPVDIENNPRFWWTDFYNRFNRFKYKANKAQGFSQEEVARSSGVVAIYGCANYLYDILL